MTTQLREHPDLPILEEIGRDLSLAYAREESAAERRRRSQRLRRIAAVTAALFVVGPGSVVATRYIWAPTPEVNAPGTPFETSRPIQIGEGSGEMVSWRISAFMSARGLCWQIAYFTVDESFPRTEACLADARKGTEYAPTAGGAPDEMVYSGVAPAGTARATVTTSQGRRLPAQVVVAPADRVERAKLPKGLRFYVATGAREEGLPGASAVAFFDASGREIARFRPPRR
jgi:hypothetical protein